MFSIKSVFWNLCQWLFKCLNCSSATPHCLPNATTHSKATHPSLAPFQSHLLHLHSVSPNVGCFSLTNNVVRNPVAHLSHTTQYGTEMRYIGFLKDFSVCHKERGGEGCNPTKPSHFSPAAAGLVQLTLQHKHSSAELFCLIPSLFRTICPTRSIRLRCILTTPSAQTGSLAFITSFRNLNFANSALWRSTESTKELLLSSVVSLLQIAWRRNSSSALWTLLAD